MFIGPTVNYSIINYVKSISDYCSPKPYLPDVTFELVFSLLDDSVEGRTSRGVGGTPTGGTDEEDGLVFPLSRAI